MAIRVFLYLRRSTKGDEDKNRSIPAQERMGREYAEQHGYEVLRAFKEIGGDSWDMERPVLNEMLALTDQHAVDKVIVVWIDRLARDGYDALTIKRRLDKAGVALESVKQPIPPPPLDEAFIMMLGVMGRQERQMTIQRIRAGVLQRLKDGKLPNAIYPLYGFRWADPHEKHGKSSYLIDEEAATVVRLIFRLMLEDWSLRQIAAHLMAQGIEPPSNYFARKYPASSVNRRLSRIWYGHTILTIISNPAYAGFYIAGRSSQTRAKGISPRHPEWRSYQQAIMDGSITHNLPILPVPPIVSLEEWRAAQAMIGHHSNSMGRPRRDREAALLTNGYTKCGYCGHNMQAVGIRSRYSYVCSHAAKKEHVPDPCPGRRFIVSCAVLDNLVWRHFMHVLSDSAAIKEKFEEWKEAHSKQLTPEHERLQTAKILLAEATQKREIYLSLLGRARNDQELGDFLLMKRQAEDQQAAAQQEIARLEATIKDFLQVEAAMSKLIYSTESIAEDLQHATYDEKRRALFSFDVRVLLKRGERLHPNATFSWLFGHPEALQHLIQESTRKEEPDGKWAQGKKMVQRSVGSQK